MNIKIICVGKIKEKFMKQGIDEYAKRMGRYGKLEIIELADEKTKENLNENEINLIKKKEAERIIGKLPQNSYNIALAIEGEKLSSEELATKLEGLMVEGKSSLVFIIGGSLGLSKDVLDLCDYSLSFSKMTFPHQLMRMILLEQIYRAFRIINNEPYHK